MLFQKDVTEFSNIAITSPQHECSGSLQIDWQKLASVELSELTSLSIVDPSLLMDHYPYVSLCDASRELDLKKAADQKSMLKLFRLAQLLLQLLAGKERNFRKDLNSTKKELLLYMDKYSQCKSQLHQQILEAKKMKENNRNLRETVKHMNSTAISKGFLQPVKCDHCYKIFRDKNFLASHQQRKHGIPEPPSTYRVGNTFKEQRTSLSHDHQTSTDQRSGNEPTNGIELTFDISPENNNPPKLPVSTHSNATGVCKSTEHVPDRSNLKAAANPNYQETCMDHQTTKKLSDVEDTCAELYEKMEEMDANFKKKELEWRTELEKNKNEYLVVQSEKVILEEKFRAQFEIMNSKIKKLEEQTRKFTTLQPNMSAVHSAHLAGKDYINCLGNSKNDFEENTEKAKSKDRSDPVERKDQSSITVGEMNAKLIANRLIQRETHELESEKSFSSYYNTAGLSSITEMSAEDESNNMKQDSICDVKSLPLDNDHQNRPGTVEEANEERLHQRRYESENNNTREQTRDVTNDFELAQETKPVREKVRFKESFLDKPEQEPVEITKRSMHEQEKEDIGQNIKGQSNMYGDSASDDTESCTPAIGHKPDLSNQLSHVMKENESSEGESTDESEDEISEQDSHNEKQDSRRNVDDCNQLTENEFKSSSLHDLLKDNAEVWAELREATNEVVKDKMKAMNAGDTITSKQYKNATQKLRYQRNILSRKYPNFKAIRNSLKNEIKMKLESQVGKVNIPENLNACSTNKNKKEKKTFSVFRHASRSVKSTLSKKSRSLKKITSRSNNLEPQAIAPDDGATPHTRTEKSCRTVGPANGAESESEIDYENPHDTSAPHTYEMTDTDTTSGSDSEENVANQVKKREVKSLLNVRGENSKVASISDQDTSGNNEAELKGVDNPAFSASGDSHLEVKNQTDESDEVSSVKGVDNLAYSHSVAETSHHKQDNEEQNATDYSSDFVSDEDESDDENSHDEEKSKPQTRVGNLFNTEDVNNAESETAHYNADAFYSSYYNVQEYKPIKLKQPTGRRIIQLKADIESQLRQRQTKKPAGAINTVLQERQQGSSDEPEAEGRADFRTQVEAFELSSDS